MPNKGCEGCRELSHRKMRSHPREGNRIPHDTRSEYIGADEGLGILDTPVYM